MRRTALVVLVAFSLVLAGCVTVKPTSTPEPTAVPTATTVAAPTAVAEDCTVFSLFPEPRDPLTVSVPKVSANDHKIGPDNARMVIIEYSDFQ